MRSLPVILVSVLLWASPAVSRDNGQWEMVGPDERAYFNTLMQPDHPTTSCCGVSDVYYADQTEPCGPEHGPQCALIAIITDTRPDAPLNRRHVPPGTRVVVPRSKIRRMPSENPTSHNLIFLGSENSVYCWEPLPGI